MRARNLRNVNLRGKQTCVSIEPEFWEAIGRIARARLVDTDVIVAEIDTFRPSSPQGHGRVDWSASARLYVVRYFLNRPTE